MRLLLAQHAEATPSDQDPERPLTVSGRADAKKMADFLQHSHLQVQRVIHSGKQRARETAEILAEVVAPEVELEQSDMLNPNDNPAAFDWQSGSWDQDTLIVGHIPFVARMVAHLLVEDVEQSLIEYQPGSIVCLERDGDAWRLIWMMRPHLLH